MTAVSLATVRRPAASIPKRWWALGLALVGALLFVMTAGTAPQPHAQDKPLFLALNDLRAWVRDNRDLPVFAILFGAPRAFIDALVTGLTGLLHTLGWPALIATMGALGLTAGGWRLAALQVVGFVILGALGLWSASVDTLGAVLAAVAISLALGIPLGILSGRRPGFRRLLTPILDVMQIMPTFAYLAPALVLFGIGPAAAAIVTLIYAMPAAIRITDLGIREVPRVSVEAGESLGATGWQLLRKVRLPLAGRALGLAVNQTIMLALSMIVITALINAPGLGEQAYSGLNHHDTAALVVAGIGIVVLAIALDRLTERASRRFDARHRARGVGVDRRIVYLAWAIAAITIVLGLLALTPVDFPAFLNGVFDGPINGFVDFLRRDASAMTSAVKDAITYGLLNPVETLLVASPWWLTIAVVASLALLISGPRQALVAALCLFGVLALGVWEHAMQTLMQVLAATALTMALGLALGIASARSDRFAAALRPFLDAAQTLPAFVYLLPALILFDVGKFTAIVAAVIFALPPVIRLVDVGIRLVPPTIIEAATSAGATGGQLLRKVQLPVARQAILLAANQAVILVLSMVVVGGLVGGQALGYDVVAGFSQNRLFGLGLAAGSALVLMGIMLDRVTQGAGGRPDTVARG
jgi:glycine betaine/proline transport system permease protein